MKHNYIIGIDFGNTLTYKLSGHDEAHRQLFPEAFCVVQWMVKQWPVHIVSKVNPKQQTEVETWLKKTNFLDNVGIPSANLHFCAERKEKAAILHKIEATHHIDDRPEVLGTTYRDDKIKGILFRPRPEEVVEYFDYLKIRDVVIANNWEEVQMQFLDYTNFPFV
jgi:hypothetical protein